MPLHNTNPGHNMPSGSLGAQPEIWLNVALTAPDGKNVWESGYTDANGDMATSTPRKSARATSPLTTQLFNLQTKFLTTNVAGTDREMFLPVNVGRRSVAVHSSRRACRSRCSNHPPLVRMEAKSIPPLGCRNANYSVPASLMTEPGVYKLSVRPAQPWPSPFTS